MKAKAFLISLSLTLFLGSSSYADTNFTIKNDSILGVKVGDSIGSVYGKFSKDEIRLEDLRQYAEGQFCPGLEIYLDDTEKPALEIMLGWDDGWIIDDIYVNDNRFKTAKGIGPGSTASELGKIYKVTYADFYEGGLYIKVEEFDGLFVSWAGGFPMALIDDPTAVELIPEGLKIEQVRIVNSRTKR